MSYTRVSCDICVFHYWFVLFPGVIPQLQSDWSLSHGLDLMRVNVRTTTTLRSSEKSCLSASCGL